ncbi:mitochondrial chaperone BCS1 protein [Rutstroemia sp. NJR-2017a WRK4]|nr:mitochondrial chaperone BCS1 protein [Rutstroemia sp. NJR-2017a WRK4]
MITNQVTRLDEALIRPSRVDKKAELGLADNEMMAHLFYLVSSDVILPEDAQSGENRKVDEAAVSQRKEAEKS